MKPSLATPDEGIPADGGKKVPILVLHFGHWLYVPFTHAQSSLNFSLSWKGLRAPTQLAGRLGQWGCNQCQLTWHEYRIHQTFGPLGPSIRAMCPHETSGQDPCNQQCHNAMVHGALMLRKRSSKALLGHVTFGQQHRAGVEPRGCRAKMLTAASPGQRGQQQSAPLPCADGFFRPPVGPPAPPFPLSHQPQ